MVWRAPHTSNAHTNHFIWKCDQLAIKYGARDGSCRQSHIALLRNPD